MSFITKVHKCSLICGLFVFCFFALKGLEKAYSETETSISSHFYLKTKKKSHQNYMAFYFDNTSFLRVNEVKVNPNLLRQGEGQEEQLGNLFTFGVEVKHFWSFSYWEFLLDLKSLYSLKEAKNYLHPREAYSYSEWPKFHLTFGRKLFLWSRSDRFWKQGLWQPRFQWNKLKVEEQGLVGLFLDNHFLNSPFRFVAFYSPLLIPETGPSFKLEDGQFKFKNPWVVPLKKRVNFEILDTKVSRDVIYALHSPEKKEVLLNQGAGFNVSWEGQKGQFASASYTYKPMNQFIEAINMPYLDLSKNNVPLVVEVAPRLTHHHLMALDIGKEAETSLREVEDDVMISDSNWNYWASLNYEKPMTGSVLGHDNTLRNGAIQIIEDSFFTSFQLGYHWKKYSRRNTYFYLCYGKLLKGGISSEGSEILREVGKIEKRFSRRYEYRDTMRFGIKKPVLKFFKTLVSSQIQLTYDLLEKGVIFETDFNFFFKTHWVINLSSNIIGLLGEKDRESFFHRYQFNDYVKMGFKYIF